MPQNQLVRRVVERLYRQTKSDPAYALADWLPTGVLLADVWSRGLMALRGALNQWRFAKKSGWLFLGRDVKIRAADRIQLGKNVSIHPHVFLDGLCKDGVVIGDYVTIREYSVIECTGVLRAPGEGLVIGNNVAITQYVFIGVRGKVVIGNNVLIGPRVTIYAGNHIFTDPDRLILQQGEDRKGITIDDDCWLGSGCTVLDGVTIGKGCVIAAGAIVTQDIPPFSIAAGVPAKVIKERKLIHESSND